MKNLILFILFSIVFYGCNGNKATVTKCNIQDDIIEEIVDLQTRLYFITPDPAGTGKVILPQGMLEAEGNVPYKPCPCVILTKLKIK